MAKAKKKQQTYKVHEPTINDGLEISSILAGGGLAGQAQRALSQIERDGMEAGISAIASLVMGGLANASVKEDMRDFLFNIWKTTEDEQAVEADKDIAGRLKARYDDDGEYVKDSAFYKKLVKFHRLPMTALIGIVTALVKTEGFKDFLDAIRMSLPEIGAGGSQGDGTSGGTSTPSNGNTGLEAVK